MKCCWGLRRHEKEGSVSEENEGSVSDENEKDVIIDLWIAPLRILVCEVSCVVINFKAVFYVLTLKNPYKQG